MALALLGLSFLGACVSGGVDEAGTNSGPECYSNSECTGARECSAGICVPYVGCSGAANCRNNEDCMDGICRLQCEQPVDCEDQGLTCGSDTQHCKPAPNPSRPQQQPKSGSGGTTSTGGGGGMGSAAGMGGAAGMGSAGTGSAGGTPGTAGSPAGVAGAPTAGFGS